MPCSRASWEQAELIMPVPPIKRTFIILDYLTGVTRKRSIYPQMYGFSSVLNHQIWGKCVTSVIKYTRSGVVFVGQVAYSTGAGNTLRLAAKYFARYVLRGRFANDLIACVFYGCQDDITNFFRRIGDQQ